MDKQMLIAANEWLEAHTHQTMLISKEEQGDLDQVRLTLDRITVRRRGSGSDDYINGAALLLQGRGTVINGNDELPLPRDTFVLPIRGLKNVRSDEQKLTLETERARYTFTLQQ